MKKLTMTEKDMMEDALSSQKQMSADYNTCASECSQKQLQAAFLNILSEEQELGSQIFDEMSARGWYQPKQAQQSDLDQVKQKFSNQ